MGKFRVTAIKWIEKQMCFNHNNHKNKTKLRICIDIVPMMIIHPQRTIDMSQRKKENACFHTVRTMCNTSMYYYYSRTC